MKRTRPKSRNELYEIASGQGGYFTAQQANAVGYYNRLQHFHRKRGNWLAIDRGIFRLRNFPNNDWEDYIHWFLWSRNKRGDPQAAISHHTAAAFHEMGDFMPSKIHLTVPAGFRRRKTPGILILHKEALRPEDIQLVGGFKITNPFRTLQDLKKVHAEPDHLQRAIEDAARCGLIRRDQRDQLRSARSPFQDSPGSRMISPS